jgi:hypothetical protein
MFIIIINFFTIPIFANLIVTTNEKLITLDCIKLSRLLLCVFKSGVSCKLLHQFYPVFFSKNSKS